MKFMGIDVEHVNVEYSNFNLLVQGLLKEGKLNPININSKTNLNVGMPIFEFNLYSFYYSVKHNRLYANKPSYYYGLEFDKKGNKMMLVSDVINGTSTINCYFYTDYNINKYNGYNSNFIFNDVREFIIYSAQIMNLMKEEGICNV